MSYMFHMEANMCDKVTFSDKVSSYKRLCVIIKAGYELQAYDPVYWERGKNTDKLKLTVHASFLMVNCSQ